MDNNLMIRYNTSLLIREMQMGYHFTFTRMIFFKKADNTSVEEDVEKLRS